MRACGICRFKRRLIAVLVDDRGRAAPALTAETHDDACWDLLAAVDAQHGLDYALVLPDDLTRVDAISHLAVARGHAVWSAPHQLVIAISSAAGVTSGARLAAMIGRLALVPPFSRHLRRIHHDDALNWLQLRLP